MGRFSHESFEEFLDSLKAAGISISNEQELRERLAETQRWRFAFMTLASNGRQLGIRFEDGAQGANEANIRQIFAEYQFPSSAEALFAASRKASH